MRPTTTQTRAPKAANHMKEIVKRPKTSSLKINQQQLIFTIESTSGVEKLWNVLRVLWWILDIIWVNTVVGAVHCVCG